MSWQAFRVIFRAAAVGSGLALVLLHAAVVDRIAVVVGNNVITESEVDEEVRVTELLNQQPLDLGPEQRRAAAERLVDQQLIRGEMQIGGYAVPPAADADALLRQFRQEHFKTMAQFRAALAHYGISEEQLKQHLLWQLTALQFTDARFRPGVPQSPVQSASRAAPGPQPLQQSANRLRPTQSRQQGADRTRAEGQADTVDQMLDAWLKEARGQTRIDFKKDAFQ